MTDSPLASFLLPQGFARPPITSLLHETRIVGEIGRFAARSHGERRERRRRPVDQGEGTEPVLLIPGFLAGDASLMAMSSSLRGLGFRTYRSRILTNIGCTYGAGRLIEARLEEIAERRGTRVQIVGHSLGGMIARGLAARRPDLVSGIVTMGSPMMAPGAHHPALSWGVEALVRLSQVGIPGLMSQDCVAGSCARESFDESRRELAADVGFTAIYSHRDGVVDWRACIDPSAVAVRVDASHCGMAVDPRVIDKVGAALRAQVGRGYDLDRQQIA
ncbi:esterase/lipase family protein [Nocardioides sp.]|uniref:esterase/lipase family protein n=1 Tax=Nocardioides sp. TaxID=35761 RepID=UPI002B26955E|nr:alpha/beta fold hydrolase [Nocardioides sp.]